MNQIKKFLLLLLIILVSIFSKSNAQFVPFVSGQFKHLAADTLYNLTGCGVPATIPNSYKRFVDYYDSCGHSKYFWQPENHVWVKDSLSGGSGGGSETWEQTLTNQGSTPITNDHTVDFGGKSFIINNVSPFNINASDPGDASLYAQIRANTGNTGFDAGNDSSEIQVFVSPTSSSYSVNGNNSNTNKQHNFILNSDSVVISGQNNGDLETKLKIDGLDSISTGIQAAYVLGMDGFMHKAAYGTSGGSSAWGDITGTLSDQTDLQSALDAKLNITDTSVINAEIVQLRNAQALKLNISDTAAMLSPYKTYYPRTALSLTTTGTSGAATYNSSTGVFNIPQYSGGGGSSFTRQVITSGTAATVTGGNYIVTIDPASTLATFALLLPASPSDLDVVEVDFGGTLTSGIIVTALTISPNSGQTILDNTPPGNAMADNTLVYRYRASNTTWYRFKP